MRERLLVAAAKVFATKGFAAASVDEIVAEAAVTKPVLYYWFPNKEGLFLELMQQAFADFSTILEEASRTHGDARQRLEALGRTILELVASNVEMARLMHSILYGPPRGAPPFDCMLFHSRLHDAARDLLAEGIRRGEFLPGDPEEYVWAVLGAMSIAIETLLVHPERAPQTDRIFSSAFAVVLRGLTACEAHKETTR